MNLAPDTLPAEIAWPLAIVLVLAYFWLEARHNRAERRRAVSEYMARYVTLDCRDGRHSACVTCGCAHHAPNLENRSQA